MFKWKVYSYSNINGKEKRFEKEFDDISEYNNFLANTPEFSSFRSPSWGISFDSLFDFNTYLDNFFHSRFSPVDESTTKRLSQAEEEQIFGIDLSKYENEIQRIEEEKQKKDEKKNMLEKSLEKLKTYLDRFKKEKRDDIVKQIEEDIKKVEKDLEELKKL